MRDHPVRRAQGGANHRVRGRLLRLAFLLWGAVPWAGCGGEAAITAPSSPSATPPPIAAGPTLKEAGATSGRWVGTAVMSSLLRSEPLYAETLRREFDYLTAEYEMKWDPIHPGPEAWNYAGADAIVDFAERNGLRVKGHTLVWHQALPAWVPELSPPELRIALEDHIRTVVGRYRGRIVAWDVVNEAVAENGVGLRDTVYRQKLGDDYIGLAFRLARAADPQALLFYNDYGAEGRGRKSDTVYELVSGLLRQGVPIDGVGLQMHVSASAAPATADVAFNLKRLTDLGLLVNISEMDVRIRDLAGPLDSRMQTQRNVYRSLVGACRAEPRCHAVTFWGFTDAHSWIDSFFGPDDPLLFDEAYRPKPAYEGVRDGLLGR